MEKLKKVVLVHPDKQHSFKTAAALLDMGVLDKYITTVYDKPGSLTHLITKLTKGTFKKKLQAHRSEDIPDAEVKLYTQFLSLLLLILVRLDKSKRFYSKVKVFRDTRFNKKVAKYCKKHGITTVVSFDVVSAQLYDALGDYKITKVLDMSAPHFDYMCKIFEGEVAKYPDSSVKGLLDSPMFHYWRSQSKKEIAVADAFLVASDFTKKSLVDSGADASKIHKCVYGLNHGLFNADDRTENTTDTLRCVYVGSITEQKGCRYLFETARRIKADGKYPIEFTVVGGYDPSNPLIECAKDYCRFTGYVLPDRLKQILLESDVFIFPSLADGFGFSVLEAMACGVVPISSRNAGVSDLVEDGKSGFVIDPMDVDAMQALLAKLYDNRALLSQMSRAASESTKNIIWDNYFADICAAFSGAEN